MNDLDKKTLRSRQYWFDDGLVELLTGGLIGVLSALFWWQSASGAGGWVIAVAMPLIILIGAFIIGWLLRTLKERFVYPRTGYVVYPKPSGKARWRNGLMGFFLGGLIAAAFSLFQLDGWTPVLMGAGFGLFLFVIGYQLALLRFQILAIWAIGVGVVVAFLSMGEPMATALTQLLVALGLLVSGGVNLWRYINNSQPPNGTPAGAK